MARSTEAHTELCTLATKWLKGKNCGVVFDDTFRCAIREIPDAIGWRSNVSILVECKVSRSDFKADSKKACRDDGNHLGDWRFYLVPDGMILLDELPEGWGLLYAKSGKVVEFHGVPSNTQWLRDKPFTGEKEAEMQMFYSSLRRLQANG